MRVGEVAVWKPQVIPAVQASCTIHRLEHASFEVGAGSTSGAVIRPGPGANGRKSALFSTACLSYLCYTLCSFEVNQTLRTSPNCSAQFPILLMQ